MNTLELSKILRVALITMTAATVETKTALYRVQRLRGHQVRVSVTLHDTSETYAHYLPVEDINRDFIKDLLNVNALPLAYADLHIEQIPVRNDKDFTIFARMFKNLVIDYVAFTIDGNKITI